MTQAKTVTALMVLLALLTACASDDASVSASTVQGVSAAPGLSVSEFVDGFNRPTQMTTVGDGRFVIAELNGDENAGTGTVTLLSPDGEDRTVLQTGLLKPTGVAVIDDQLWIMEERRLSVTTLEPGAAREVVFDELPFNGRSEGTLTVTPTGELLFNTSGSKRGSEVVTDSGTLFRLDVTTRQRTVVATGLKHGYAHAFDNEGGLWVTEMTDGKFDGTDASDELMRVTDGDNFAWPQCVENNRPVQEFAGTEALCATAPPSHALFGARATPTSVTIAPWDSDQLLVALWFTGEIVSVPRSAAPTGEPWNGETVMTGVERPQHLLTVNDQVLLVDHTGGRVLALER